MLEITLKPIPAQTFSVTLNKQNCHVALYTKQDCLFIDLKINDVPVVYGVLVRDRQNLIVEPYKGLVGNLRFVDIKEKSDPNYLDFNERYKLIYDEQF